MRTVGLTKTYHGTKALDDCSLTLARGKIYGLVGKNGAGKTTLMRLIAGLAFPMAGTVETATGRIGALIESPALCPSMTAAENLRYYRLLAEGRRNDGRDRELLELVGLTGTGKKKVRDFSLGMRQRLGIAAVLLGNPEFIMLDEPVNGLDPVGVVEIRQLIGRLNREFGMTVLISSHNLPELYQTATDYIILDHGQVRKEITQEELEREAHESLEAYFLNVVGKGRQE